MREIFPMYRDAWQAVAAEVVVRYRSGRPVPSGRFWPKQTPPNIRIYRRGSTPSSRLDQSDEPSRFFSDGIALTSAELLAELITLCHEFGHFKSFIGATPRDEWERYFDLVYKFDEARERVPDEGDQQRREIQKDLTPGERRVIRKEEELAWRLGREFFQSLHGVVVDDLTLFDRNADAALADYQRLGIEPVQ